MCWRSRTSWTALPGAVRLPPGADVTTITRAQIRQLVDRLTDAGQWQHGDRDILIVLDAGYEAPRIAWLLRDLPIEILGRMRSDRVLRRATPPSVYQPRGGRPAKHGGEFVFGDAATWGGEHTFRLLKQTLGWTAPQLREPAAADRWTWLLLAAHTQLRLARPIAQDLRRPWERPMAPERLTPDRVRRGFRNLRATSPSPACAPKPSRPGPGRPAGSRNRHTAARHDVGLLLVTGQAHQRPDHHKKGTKPRRTG